MSKKTKTKTKLSDVPDYEDVSDDSNDDELGNHHDADAYYLPVLYNLDKNGNKRMWKIWIVKDTIYRLSGLKKGKKVSFERTFEGKNGITKG